MWNVNALLTNNAQKSDYFDVEKGLGRADELGYARFEIGWKTKILSQQNGLEEA